MPTTTHLDHLRDNLKGEQLLEERYRAIDRENRILLEKMSNTMKQQSHNTPRAKSAPQSLNKDARKAELVRITKDNFGILKRIQQAQPVVNHIALEEEYRKSFGHLKNATEYPVVIRQKVPPSAIGSLTSIGQGIGGHIDALTRPASAGNLDAGKGAAADVGELKYVLKEGRQIGERYYLVEMATDGRTLAICAYNGEGQPNLELVVGEQQHKKLYKQCKSDYSALADRLVVEGGALFIDASRAVDRVYSDAQAERRHQAAIAGASPPSGRHGAPRRPLSAAPVVGREAREQPLEARIGQKSGRDPWFANTAPGSRPSSSGRGRSSGCKTVDLHVQEL